MGDNSGRLGSGVALSSALALVGVQAGLASAEELRLEEVIVTAQKKSESLADIPMTVQAISGDLFNEFASFDFRDLDKLAAGVTISGSNFDTDIAIRGLGTNLNAPVTPRVTVYWDGASVAQTRMLFTNQFDIGRFELLRGPQGTLYGRSSPAGAITIQSRSPSMENYEGYIQQSFAERGQANTQLGVSLPVIKDKLSFRVAGVYDRANPFGVENITLDRDNVSYGSGGRFIMAWNVTDNFDLRLSYNHQRSKVDIDPVVEGNGIDYDDRKAVADFASYYEELSRITVLDMNWLLPADLELTSISSYQTNTVERFWDGDFSQVQGQEQKVVSDVYSVWNTELRLASQGNDRWDWIAGLYYQQSLGDTPVNVNDYRVVAIPDYVTLLTKVSGPSLNNSEEYAVFMHNAFHLTDNTTLTLGVRYNRRESNNSQVFVSNSFLPPDADEPVDTRTLIGVPPEAQEMDNDAVTGTLKLQHHFNDALMGYASYDRGWRDGAVNIAGAPQPPVWAGIAPETSDNFELGAKWRVLGGRGLFSIAGYYQIYQDFQYEAGDVQYVDDLNSIQQASPVVNVEEVVSSGIDADFNVILLEGWWLNAAVSYNNTEFTDASDVPCTVPGALQPDDPAWTFNTCDLKGEPAGTQPQWSSVVTSEYSRAIGNTATDWFLRGLYKVESERWDNDIEQYLSGYYILDLFAGVRAQSWDVTFWVKNVLDRSNKLDVANAPLVPDYSVLGTRGEDVGTFAFVPSGYQWIENQLQPRTLGLTAAYRF